MNMDWIEKCATLFAEPHRRDRRRLCVDDDDNDANSFSI